MTAKPNHKSHVHYDHTDQDADKSLTDKAKDAAATAQGKVAKAASSTVEAAKDHPVAAAGIAAGVVAAVAGGAFAASKLRDGGSDSKPKPKSTAKKSTAKKSTAKA